jgi:hypothetical protein
MVRSLRTILCRGRQKPARWNQRSEPSERHPAGPASPAPGSTKPTDKVLTHGEFVQALAEGLKSSHPQGGHSLPWPVRAAVTTQVATGGAGVGEQFLEVGRNIRLQQIPHRLVVQAEHVGCIGIELGDSNGRPRAGTGNPQALRVLGPLARQG